MLLLLCLLSSAMAKEPSLLGRPELGLGFRNAMGGWDDPGTYEGPRLAVRQPLGALTLEGSFFYRLAPDDAPDVAATVARIHQYQTGWETFVPYALDRWAGTVLVDWGFGRRPGEARFTAGPHLLGGLELHQRQQLWVSAPDLEPVVTTGETSLVPGAIAGVTIDAFAMQRVGLRLCWYGRVSMDPETPDYDPTAPPQGASLTITPTIAADLLVRL